MKKKAIVLGASGSAGSYQVEFLRDRDYDVYAMGREECDFGNQHHLLAFHKLLLDYKPNEIYNWAGRSFVPESWTSPNDYMQVNGLAVGSLLRDVAAFWRGAKFFTASSAEIFEKEAIFHYEDTNRLPSSPYGLSKMVALEFVRIYREKFGLFACAGILYNMESPRRPKKYFAEKVASEVVRLAKLGRLPNENEKIELGALDAIRDWGLAREYVEAAWRILQHDTATDYCIATGASYTCKEFVATALLAAGFEIKDGNIKPYVKFDEKVSDRSDRMYCRSTKMRQVLGWQPQAKMPDVVMELVQHYYCDTYKGE